MKKHTFLALTKYGMCIKCPEWLGYWKWEDDTIKMYCKDGRIIDIRESKDIKYTIGFILRDDWEIMSESAARKIWDNRERIKELIRIIDINQTMISNGKDNLQEISNALKIIEDAKKELDEYGYNYQEKYKEWILND